MKQRQVLILIAIIVLAAGFFWWRSTTADKSEILEKRLAEVFAKSGLTGNNLVRRSSEERGTCGAKYTHTFMEYNVPKVFVWSKFESALRGALNKTSFRITKADLVSKRGAECYNVTINRGKRELFTLKMNKTRLLSSALVPAFKAHASPNVAIVMDDFGYNMNDFETLFGIKEPITLSILPDQRYSREIAVLARSRGYEIIMHLPLEPKARDVVEEADTIRSAMSEKEIIASLKKELETVPGADGVSNHMGSKGTEDRKLMTVILKYLKANNLYFFDSLTSQNSVCKDVASSLGLRYARRDIFLDNSGDIPHIEKQLVELRDTAFARGSVIAICHDRKNTIMVLSRMMPAMARDGIKFVRLSDMVK